jgi:hypothetical protein
MSYVHVPRVYGRAAVASVINNEETILNLLKQKKTKVNSARGALRSKPNSWWGILINCLLLSHPSAWRVVVRDAGVQYSVLLGNWTLHISSNKLNYRYVYTYTNNPLATTTAMYMHVYSTASSSNQGCLKPTWLWEHHNIWSTGGFFSCWHLSWSILQKGPSSSQNQPVVQTFPLPTSHPATLARCLELSIPAAAAAPLHPSLHSLHTAVAQVWKPYGLYRMGRTRSGGA